MLFPAFRKDLPLPPAIPASEPPGSRGGSQRSLARPLAWLLAASLALSACASLREREVAGPYSFRVSPGRTFELATGREISSEQLARRLRGARLLFLGEHHSEPRSHRFQEEILRMLVGQGRKVTVAVEMFPPSADAALEEWRNGDLAEAEFLEKSGWYETWRLPWAYYRGIFRFIREAHLPVKGVNAEPATVTAVRAGKTADLAPALREEVGDPEATLEPHRQYLQDALRATGHGDSLDLTSPGFRNYLRVQRLWDRLMGVRAARLALAGGEESVVVVLIGSGHLAYKLGANLHAAGEAELPQLTFWDDVVAKAGPTYPVPVGIADFARVYEADPDPSGYPGLGGLKLETAAEGVRIAGFRAHGGGALPVLKKGDVIHALNGRATATPAALRLAFEQLAPGSEAEFDVTREGKRLKVTTRVSVRRRRPGSS